MEIAKGVAAEAYKSLNLSDYKNPSWQTAIGYLEQRLCDRYIDPIETLIHAEDHLEYTEKKFGFAILALDILLIETLQSFYDGYTNSEHKSRKLFKRFLTQRKNFKAHFTSEMEATQFFDDFRCGLLHQAQTFGNTRIWTVGEFITRTYGFVTLNRTLFHEAIKDEIKIYLELLREQQDFMLLENFKHKMDYITEKKSTDMGKAELTNMIANLINRFKQTTDKEDLKAIKCEIFDTVLTLPYKQYVFDNGIVKAKPEWESNVSSYITALAKNNPTKPLFNLATKSLEEIKNLIERSTVSA